MVTRRRRRLDQLLEAGLPALTWALRVELTDLEWRIRARIRRGRATPRLDRRLATLRELVAVLGAPR